MTHHYLKRKANPDIFSEFIPPPKVKVLYAINNISPFPSNINTKDCVSVAKTKHPNRKRQHSSFQQLDPDCQNLIQRAKSPETKSKTDTDSTNTNSPQTRLSSDASVTCDYLQRQSSDIVLHTPATQNFEPVQKRTRSRKHISAAYQDLVVATDSNSDTLSKTDSKQTSTQEVVDSHILKNTMITKQSVGRPSCIALNNCMSELEMESPEYNSFNYWRQSLPDIVIDFPTHTSATNTRTTDDVVMNDAASQGDHEQTEGKLCSIDAGGAFNSFNYWRILPADMDLPMSE